MRSDYSNAFQCPIIKQLFYSALKAASLQKTQIYIKNFLAGVFLNLLSKLLLIITFILNM